MRKIVYDIEADSLTPTRIWCVVAKDIDTNEVFTFLEHERDAFALFCKSVDTFIGHNIIGYDNYWVNKLWNIGITTEQSIDTLVLSRLFNPCKEIRMQGTDGKWKGKVKQKRAKNEHNLGAWGEVLGEPKISFNDFSKFTEEMLTYCIQDVHVNHKVYNYLRDIESRGFSKQSISIEQKLVEILEQQMRNGFKIKVTEAKELLDLVTNKALELEARIQEDFPPLPKFIKEYTPRLNKDGKTYNLSSMGPLKQQYGFAYQGDPYSSIEWQEFNLGSPIQVVARLKGHWKPVEFTKKGQPRCSDKNISTVFDTAPPSIRNIKTYRMYMSRVNELTAWIKGADKHGDKRLRGTIYHLGSWSGRASHSDPNTSNITGISYSDDKPVLGEQGSFGFECRSLWTVEEGNVLIGCDASGIQLRILAHYLNNPTYTKAVLDDIHNFNARTLGCSRDDAKTFIYSWLLGAGLDKTADILNCSNALAYTKREQFVRLTPGLQAFLARKTTYANRGWYKGLDGRKVYVPS